MITLLHPAWREGESLGEYLQQGGVANRRDFLKFCGRMAGLFALSPLLPGEAHASAEQVAATLTAVKKPTVVWLQLQECPGCLESTLRSGHTTIEQMILNLISLNYCELVMAAAGEQATAALETTNREPHVLVVNGSIPLGIDGAFCTIGGKSAQQVLREAAANASAILAVGACAYYGCVQAAAPNPTTTVGVRSILADREVINVPGCPPIPDVITATIMYVLTYGKAPALDEQNRPLFAFGGRIHDNCPRRAHFNAGQFVETFGDNASRQGHCLYKVGCKGPNTFAACPIIKWNLETSFPIQAGHPCLGCTDLHFFDRNTPFYHRLPNVPGMPIETTANQVGAVALGAVGAGIAVHAVGTALRRAVRRHEQETVPLATFGEREPGDKEENQ